jgi:hypothetical protein
VKKDVENKLALLIVREKRPKSFAIEYTCRRPCWM